MANKMKTNLLTFSLFFVLLFAADGFAQKAKVESVYTSLNTKNCKTLEQSDEGTGWYRGECKGVSGYRLQITEGDIRQSIDVITPNKKKFQLDFARNVSVAFSSVGAKAEWRVVRKDKKLVPFALIVRFDASENPENPTKNTSYLVISKITKTKICITDVIKPSAMANEEARKLADSAPTKSCKISKD
jgi:hypothetical protein